jgi:hypothetical protein
VYVVVCLYSYRFVYIQGVRVCDGVSVSEQILQSCT